MEIRTQKYKSMIENIERGLSDSVVVRSPEPVPSTANQQLPKFLPLEEKEWVQKELDQFIESL